MIVVMVMSTVLVVNMFMLFVVMVMDFSSMPHFIVLVMPARIGPGLRLERDRKSVV